MKSRANMIAALRSPHAHSQLMQLTSALFGMVTFLCFARWMPASEVGELVLFITAITLLDMLRSGFFQPAFIRTVNREDADQRRAVRGSVLLLALSWSLGSALLVSLVGMTGIMDRWIPDQSMVVVAWPLGIIATFPGQYATWKAQAESRFDRVLIYRLINSTLVLVGVVALQHTGRLQPQTVAFLFAGAAGISSMSAALLGWTNLTDIVKASYTHAKEIVRFGRYAMTTALGASLLRSSDTFLIGAFMDTQAVAIYGLAQKAVEVLDLPLRALSASVYPIMASSGTQFAGRRIGRIIERVTGGYILAMALPAAIIAFAAAPLVVLVAGDTWMGAVPIIQIFVVAAFLMPLDRMIGLGLDSLGKPAINMAKVLAMLTCNIVGDIVVLKWFGTLESVAAVTILMNATGLVYGWVALKSDTRMSMRRIVIESRRWLSPAHFRLRVFGVQAPR